MVKEYPKKRGRKPKKIKKDLDVVEEKKPKKRGRKPKIRTPEEIKKINEKKKPKKRGRKPKEKIYGLTEIKKNVLTENNIIVHLPLFKKDIKATLETYNHSKKTIPKPNETNNLSNFSEWVDQIKDSPCISHEKETETIDNNQNIQVEMNICGDEQLIHDNNWYDSKLVKTSINEIRDIIHRKKEILKPSQFKERKTFME